MYRYWDLDILTGILRGIGAWMYHRLCRENLGVMMREDVVDNRLKGDVRIYEIDIDFDYCDEIEIDGYCEVCMTLIYICTIAR